MCQEGHVAHGEHFSKSHGLLMQSFFGCRGGQNCLAEGRAQRRGRGGSQVMVIS